MVHINNLRNKSGPGARTEPSAAKLEDKEEDEEGYTGNQSDWGGFPQGRGRGGFGDSSLRGRGGFGDPGGHGRGGFGDPGGRGRGWLSEQGGRGRGGFGNESGRGRGWLADQGGRGRGGFGNESVQGRGGFGAGLATGERVMGGDEEEDYEDEKNGDKDGFWCKACKANFSSKDVSLLNIITSLFSFFLKKKTHQIFYSIVWGTARNRGMRQRGTLRPSHILVLPQSSPVGHPM